jgi:hypothetical protein
MMSWLVASKVIPPLLGGNPPDYSISHAARTAKSEAVCWRISWNERRIGTAMTQVIQRFGGGITLRHLVHFERMPLDAMLSEGLGLLSSVVRPLLGTDRDFELDVQLATELRFDRRQRFREFQSVVDLGDMEDFLHLKGKRMEGRKLEIVTRLGANQEGISEQIWRNELDLPGNTLVSDTFAPRPELRNLRVGQRWTVPVYRPFPPHAPVQIVEAIAERLDVIVWDGRDVETILVLYREDAGSGLHASREPVLKEWVSGDGLVVRREMRFSGLHVVFDRLTTPTEAAELDKLNPVLHPRLWTPR